MPKISFADLKPGMILAKPIRREKDGLVLLQNNIELKQSYIDQIAMLNLDSVCIRENQIPDETDNFEAIKEETRVKAITLLRTTFRNFKQNRAVDIDKLKNLVNEFLAYILNDSCIVYTITKIKAYDNYTFTHSVDVGVLSLLIGSVMGLSRNKLEILGISALLHDIGKTFVDLRLLNKPSKLDADEYEKIKAHTRDGYNLLKKRPNLSFLIPHMALQHHERDDGSGYPRGLTAKRIHPFAKIIAVADVFDAMTSQRNYQKSVPSAVAIQEIYANTPLKYNQIVVDNFTKIVTPYSKGSILLLNNHQIVEVGAISRGKCLVKVISGLHKGELFNLYQKSELLVLKWLS